MISLRPEARKQWQAAGAANFSSQCRRRNTLPTKQVKSVVTHVISVREVIGSSLGWGSGCLDSSLSFSHSFEMYFETVPPPVADHSGRAV
jgi:hypothetical protein